MVWCYQQNNLVHEQSDEPRKQIYLVIKWQTNETNVFSQCEGKLKVISFIALLYPVCLTGCNFKGHWLNSSRRLGGLSCGQTSSGSTPQLERKQTLLFGLDNFINYEHVASSLVPSQNKLHIYFPEQENSVGRCRQFSFPPWCPDHKQAGRASVCVMNAGPAPLHCTADRTPSVPAPVSAFAQRTKA